MSQAIKLLEELFSLNESVEQGFVDVVMFPNNWVSIKQNLGLKARPKKSKAKIKRNVADWQWDGDGVTIYTFVNPTNGKKAGETTVPMSKNTVGDLLIVADDKEKLAFAVSTIKANITMGRTTKKKFFPR